MFRYYFNALNLFIFFIFVQLNINIKIDIDINILVAIIINMVVDTPGNILSLFMKLPQLMKSRYGIQESILKDMRVYLIRLL